jgi:predicted 3-demethylubiquinone-9 3-methyltransferase (glyoxalase superfamily)
VGPHPDGTPNPSISFSLWIKDKDLTKTIRDQLADGGAVMMEFNKYPRSPGYGRCNDKYGVSRQVMYDDREETHEHALVPSLLFVGENTGKAQEAMDLYTSIFPQSTIDFIRTYGEQPGAQDNPNHIAHAEFKLANQQFIIADSGLEHKFQFNDGISLAVSCKDQAELDTYRDALIADGGQEVQCWWCKDKYGVSRQIVPEQLGALISDPDREKSGRATQTMLKMKKLDIAKIEDAFYGR